MDCAPLGLSDNYKRIVCIPFNKPRRVAKQGARGERVTKQKGKTNKRVGCEGGAVAHTCERPNDAVALMRAAAVVARRDADGIVFDALRAHVVEFAIAALASPFPVEVRA